MGSLQILPLKNKNTHAPILGLQPRDKAAVLGLKREMLLFFTTNMAAVVSLANLQ